MQIHKYDTVIVGAGGAGMRAAIESTKRSRTAVLTKLYPTRSHTGAAQGGMAAALANVEEDNWEWHTFDTIKGGDYLVDQDAAEILAKEAIDAVLDLEKMGLPFNRTPEGKIDQRRFGGHTRNHGDAPVRRACYAADRTGHMILQTLYQNCVKQDVEFFNEFYVLDLLVDHDLAASHVPAGEEVHVVRAQVAQVEQALEDAVGGLAHGLGVGAHRDLGVRGRLVGVGDAHEVGDLAGHRLLVAAGVVSGDEHLHRAVHEDLHEATDLPAELVARIAVGRERGHDGHALGAGDAAGGEAQALHQEVAVLLGLVEALGEELGDGEVRQIVARAEIAAQEIAEIVDILQPKRIVEAELGFEVGLDLGAQAPFLVERAARRDADQEERHRHDDE